MIISVAAVDIEATDVFAALAGELYFEKKVILVPWKEQDHEGIGMCKAFGVGPTWGQILAPRSYWTFPIELQVLHLQNVDTDYLSYCEDGRMMDGSI